MFIIQLTSSMELPPSKPVNILLCAKSCTPAGIAPQKQPARLIKVLQSSTLPQSKGLNRYTTLNATQLSQGSLALNKILAVCHTLLYSTAQKHCLSTTVFLLKCFQFPGPPETICRRLQLPNPSNTNLYKIFISLKPLFSSSKLNTSFPCMKTNDNLSRKIKGI